MFWYFVPVFNAELIAEAYKKNCKSVLYRAA